MGLLCGGEKMILIYTKARKWPLVLMLRNRLSPKFVVSIHSRLLLPYLTYAHSHHGVWAGLANSDSIQKMQASEDFPLIRMLRIKYCSEKPIYPGFVIRALLGSRSRYDKSVPNIPSPFTTSQSSQLQESPRRIAKHGQGKEYRHCSFSIWNAGLGKTPT
jgi:hypothetical protein